MELARTLTAQLAAFWDSPAADPPDGADRYDPPLALTGQDQQPVGANPYWEIVRWLPRFPLTGEPFANPRIPALPGLLGIKRQLRKQFSYAIPSPAISAGSPKPPARTGSPTSPRQVPARATGRGS